MSGPVGSVQRPARYLALGVTLDGDRDELGVWLLETEGATFWMQVLVAPRGLLNRMEVGDHHRRVIAATPSTLSAGD